MIIGAEYGLDIEREFSEFAPKIESVIKDLNLRKDMALYKNFRF